MKTDEEIKTEIPYGYCHCGCGQKTTLYTRTDKRLGVVKGTPAKFLRGHHRIGIKAKLRKNCKRGHLLNEENIDNTGACLICKKETNKKWVEKNKEHLKNYRKIYCKKNNEHIAKGKAEWKAKNPEKVKLSNKKRNAKITELLTDSLIAARLKLPVSQAPLNLLEAKRIHTQIKRKLKELKNGNNARY